MDKVKIWMTGMVVLLLLLTIGAGTVAAAQYNSATRYFCGGTAVHSYNFDSGVGGVGLPTVKPVAYPQIRRGDTFIPITGVINPISFVDAKRDIYTSWIPEVNIYSKPTIPLEGEPETDNPVTTDSHEIEEPVKVTANLVVSVTTDKEVYYAGEPVNIKISLTNNGPDTVDRTRYCIGEPMKDPDAACLHFFSGKHADFCITTGMGRQAYLWSYDKGYAASLTGIAIKHGETRELLSATWDQKDNNGNHVSPRKYYIDGWMVLCEYPTPYTIQSPIHGERIEIRIIAEGEYTDNKYTRQTIKNLQDGRMSSWRRG